MRNNERKLMTPVERRSIAVVIMILLLFALFFLISNCTSYHPSFYPSYDVLNPRPEVKANPYGTAARLEDGTYEIRLDSTLEHKDNYFLVNQAFWQWVAELKEEVKRLRGN